jgi:exosome complex RNA-binding protein Rrp4
VSGTGRFTNSVISPTFIGNLSGNSDTATKFISNRTNYKGVTDDSVVGQLMWNIN